MKIYHIELAKFSLGTSGGEKCMIEIIKFMRDKKIKNVIITTDNGKKTYEDFGLISNDFIEYIIINSYKTERFHIFISYILRVFLFFKIKNNIIKTIDKEDLLMCHSDFFPNTIASYFLSKYFTKKYYWFHMLCPNIFKGFEGHFLNKFKFPSIKLIHYKLNQILFFLIAKNDTIITVNPYYKNIINKVNKKTYILEKFGGENVYIINKYSGITNNTQNNNIYNKKIYDIVFMGRFHEQKGLFEIPKILKILKKRKDNIKLLIIGGGNKKIEKKFFDIIKNEKLEDNIEYAGFISSDKKFELIKKSKIFIFPSYYESFGQVALEAMANALPVVAYDLPVYCVFKMGMIKVPIINNVIFAEEILKLINNEEYYKKISQDAIKYASTFSWKETGEEIYDLIINKKK